MRDIELTSETDLAYASPAPGGIPVDTVATDPSFTDTKAYTKPSLGGEFGPAGALLLGAPADGGEALLAAVAVVTVTPPVVPTPPNAMALGRAANSATVLNLYPWRKVPPQGLDMNNPYVPPVVEDPPPPPPPTGITFTSNLENGDGSAHFSGPAQRNATIRVTYRIGSGITQSFDVHILTGDNGTQIAAKVRAAIDATFGLDASGTGGTVNVVGLGGNLSHFDITVL